MLDLILSRLNEAPLYEDETTSAQIAIVAANVGKSSLLNKLLGQELVVVSDVPGTTRDAIDTEVEYAGRKLVLVTTAGSATRADRAGIGIQRAALERSVARADVILLLVDATEWSPPRTCTSRGTSSRKGRGWCW